MMCMDTISSTVAWRLSLIEVIQHVITNLFTHIHQLAISVTQDKLKKNISVFCDFFFLVVIISRQFIEHTDLMTPCTIYLNVDNNVNFLKFGHILYLD